MSSGKLWYLGCFPDEALWDRVIELAAREARIALHPMPAGLRRRETAEHVFLINYNAQPVTWNDHDIGGCDVAILRRNPPGQD